jgi:adenylyltransferase/sulfurtransferase
MLEPPDTERYAKQVLFYGIGPEGQRALGAATVAIVGLGALGTVIADTLCRAGVGALRLVDRDFVELSNLQRQTLFTERDAQERLPKAVAAARRLGEINSSIRIEPLIRDLHPGNTEATLRGADLVLDGTDNIETRLLINDACLKLGIPWVYGAALGAQGNAMTILPGQTPCLRCLIPDAPPPGAMPTCDSEGVLAPITGLIGAWEAAEALRLLTGQPPRPGLLLADVWQGDVRVVELERRPDCPACRGVYDYLTGQRTAFTTSLCGRNAVQISPADERQIPLEALQARLARIGQATYNGFLLTYSGEGVEITLFPTGRAIIKGTTDEAVARALYARYVGT